MLLLGMWVETASRPSHALSLRAPIMCGRPDHLVIFLPVYTDAFDARVRNPWVPAVLSRQYPSCYSPSEDGLESNRHGRPDCGNRYKSILSASYFTLLNLFGEFPLMDNHSTAGRFIGVFTAVVSHCLAPRVVSLLLEMCR